MDPIQVLMDEHRRIERVLGALGGCAARLATPGAVPREDVHAFVRFIREYADALHHGKEEDMLFQEMMAAGMPREAGPLAVMYYEHDEGRGFVGRMAEASAGAGPLDETAARRVAGAMRGYAALLRDHIAKEDQILYPMARQLLPPAVMQDLGRRFETYAAEDPRAHAAPALLAAADDLARRYAAGV